MITDLFSARYHDYAWGTDRSNEVLAVRQMARLWHDSSIRIFGKEFVDEMTEEVHCSVCREIGEDELFGPPHRVGGLPRQNDWAFYCCEFLMSLQENESNFDHEISNRLNILEILFQKFENRDQEEEVRATLQELNQRLRRLSFPFHYQAGMFHKADDALSETRIEAPFWEVLRGERWCNVDADIRAAIGLRDTGGRDPAFHAAKALESAIKIISDERGLSGGRERGAANFIENLASERAGHFITSWEADTLRSFFKHVRNPLGHGAGGGPMLTLTPQQTDWAIEFCMSWIKSLIRRM
ncbi:hypothetical protein WI697_07900 [Tistrella mobilis]|uniref:hypothetical protein n=1 Tax=Tistrella mobilis TaxID=171437 RepID=UPI0031F71DBB